MTGLWITAHLTPALWTSALASSSPLFRGDDP